jgi:hypothetical protein
MKNEPLSPLFSITLLYLVLPGILFAVGWLRPVFAALNLVLLSLFCAALIGDLRQWFRHTGARSGAVSGLWAALSPRRGLLLPAALLFLWLMLSGAGGFGGQVKDYRASNALFLDLIVQD